MRALATGQTLDQKRLKTMPLVHFQRIAVPVRTGCISIQGVDTTSSISRARLVVIRL